MTEAEIDIELASFERMVRAVATSLSRTHPEGIAQ